MTNIITKEGQNSSVYEYGMLWGCLKDATAVGTRYISPGQNTAGGMIAEDLFWTAPSDCTIESMYVHCNTAPGGADSGKYVDVTLRNSTDAADTTSTTRVFEVATDNSDTTHHPTISAGDRLIFKVDVVTPPAVVTDISVCVLYKYAI